MADTLDIYLYKNVNGKIIEIPAFIFIKEHANMLLVISAYDRDNQHFLDQIAKEPGMAFNNIVWFRKKSFNKAKEILMCDIMEKLNNLYSKEQELKNQLGFISNQEE